MDNAETTPVYRCGNLEYTRRGLAALFAWLLWGDFCFTLMEAIVPSILPLKLKGLESSNFVIGLILTALPGIFNTTLCPWISFKSDRHRGPRGRRIPFILYTIPFLAASLVLIGLSDDIGRWVHAAFLAENGIRQATVIVVLIAVFAACFDLFNMFVSSVFYYLFNDVVPLTHLGRFMSWFKAIGTLSGALYNYFVFKYAGTHMREIYLAVAALYFISFGLLCLRVRERDYPPPSDAAQKPSLARDIRTFVRECYTNRFYWDLFLSTTFMSVGWTIGVFLVFFRQSLGLDLDLIGALVGTTMLVTSALLLFAGQFVDKWNPVRIAAYAATMTAFSGFAGWIWLFADPPSARFYFWATALSLPFAMLVPATASAASGPREMMLFPADRFGQFCGAQALVRSAGTMIGGPLAGLFMDSVAHFAPDNLYAYRFIFVWGGVFTIVSFYFHYRGYRVWKRLGSEAGYSPPTSNCRMEDLPPRSDSPGLKKGILLMLGVSAYGGVVADVAYVTWYCLAGDLSSAGLFGFHILTLIAMFFGCVAFIRFMERP